MALETATYVDALVVSNPDGGDARNTADDHLRLIKAALKRTLPMLSGAVSASAQAITYVNDLTAPVQNQINELRDGSATARNAVNSRYANSASVAANIGTIPSARVADTAAANIFTQAQFFKRSSPYLLLDDDDSVADVARWYIQATNSGSTGVFRLAGLDDAGVTPSIVFDVFKISAGATPYMDFQARPLLTGTYAFLHSGDAIDAASVGGTASAGMARLATAQSFSKGQAITQADLAGTTFAPNCDDTTMFRYALGGASTIAAPSNARSGMVISFHLIQSTAGSTVTWASAFKFPGGTAPTLSTGSSQVDVLAFQYDSTSAVWRQAGLNVG